MKVWTRQPIHILKIHVSHLFHKMKQNFSSPTYFSVCFSILVFISNYKNIKKFMSEIFKHTISGKLDAEKAPQIEVCVNPKNN